MSEGDWWPREGFDDQYEQDRSRQLINTDRHLPPTPPRRPQPLFLRALREMLSKEFWTGNIFHRKSRVWTDVDPSLNDFRREERLPYVDDHIDPKANPTQYAAAQNQPVFAPDLRPPREFNFDRLIFFQYLLVIIGMAIMAGALAFFFGKVYLHYLSICQSIPM